MNDNYLKIANSPGMWIASGIIIIVLAFQVLRFTYLSFRAGKKIGISRSKMLMAFRLGITMSIVPSIAIIMGLVMLVPKLGLPFSWMRLGVNGSAVYELIAAGTAANEMGYKGFAGDFNSIVFANIVWTMSAGIMFGLLFIAFFTPRLRRLKEVVGGKDDRWLRILTLSTFFGALAYMIGQSTVRGGSALTGLAGGFVIMGLFGVIITAGKQKWLKEWALSISIVAAMAVVGLAYHFLDIGG